MDKSTISTLMSHLGSLGGKARAKSLSKKRRIEIATKASHARIKKNGHIASPKV